MRELDSFCITRSLRADGLAGPATYAGRDLHRGYDSPQTASRCDLIAVEMFTSGMRLDEYRLVSPLGRGTFGEVWLAHDTLLDRAVALKFLTDSQMGSVGRARFMVEARALARLRHPNVVAVHRLLQRERILALVSEYIKGQPLDRIVHPLSEAQLLDIAIDLVRGLAAAHSCGILHRDVKPANAILGDDGVVRLLDFGLAELRATAAMQPGSEGRAPERGKLVRSIAVDADATPGIEDAVASSRKDDREPMESSRPSQRTGSLVGTPYYMAPEIWDGEPSTPRSDLYSLGALLFELAAGQPPHAVPEIELLRVAVTTTEAAPVRSLRLRLDPALAAWIDRCVRRDPRQRPSSASEMAAALAALRDKATSYTVPSGNPYRGLRTFEAEHRALFFGRSQDRFRVLERLRVESMLLVTGDSGIGKSSLCRAGVLPLIQAGALGDGRSWSSGIVSPGRRPLLALAEALAACLGESMEHWLALSREQPLELARSVRRVLGDRRGLALLFDQMEELVTQADAAEALRIGEILGQLVEQARGVRILGTVRGDFLTRLAEATDLSDELLRGIYLLRPLGLAELREVVIGPAKVQGVSFESEAMIDEMVRSTAAARGGLPLLQFTLAELWEARDQTQAVIPVEALRRLGGVAGALARHADGVLATLLPPQRAAALQLLGKLVTAEGTRQRRTRQELLTDDPAEPVALDLLTEQRLLVAGSSEGGEASYELAHEALVSHWDALKNHLASDADRRQVKQRLESAAAEWERLNRSADALLGQRQLLEVDDAGIDLRELTPRAGRFVSASRGNLRGRELRRRLLFVGAALLALAVLGALWQWQRRVELEERQTAQEIHRLLGQPDREIEAAEKAVALTGKHVRRGQMPPAYSIEALYAVVMSEGLALPPLPHGAAVTAVAFSQDDRLVLTGAADGRISIWGIQDSSKTQRLDAHTGAVRKIITAPDGQHVFSLGEDGALKIWRLDGEAPGLALIAELPGILRFELVQRLLFWDSHGCFGTWSAASGRKQLGCLAEPVERLTFSPEGRLGAVVGSDATARIYDVESGKQVAALPGHSDKVTGAAFSQRGDLLATYGMDKVIRIWTVGDWQLKHTVTGHKSEVSGVTFFGAQGRLVSTGIRDVSARLFDTSTGTGISVLRGHSNRILDVSVAPDHNRIYSLAADLTMRIWDAETGESKRSIRVPRGTSRIHISTRGRYVAFYGDDQRLRLWDTERGATTTLAAHRDSVWSLAAAPGTPEVATVSADHSVRIWNLVTGQQHVLSGHTAGVIHAAYSPDGTKLVSSGYDSTVRVWDAQAKRPLFVLQGHQRNVNWSGFSPDGTRIISTGDDGTARIWNAATGQPIHTFAGHHDAVYVPGFDPSGSKVATASKDGTIKIWDVTTGAEELTLGSNPHGYTSAVFVDSGLLAGGSWDGTIQLWDVQNRRQLGSLTYHTAMIRTMVLIPSQRLLVSASLDGLVIVWDLAVRKPKFVFSTHTGSVLSVSVSRDGSRLASSGNDGTARIWSLEDGSCLAVLGSQTGAVMGTEFVYDGSQVVTASIDRMVRSYSMRLEQVFDLACKRIKLWGGSAGEYCR